MYSILHSMYTLHFVVCLLCCIYTAGHSIFYHLKRWATYFWKLRKNVIPLQWWITLPQSLFLLRQARFPTINKCLFALVSATFILFSESMNPICLVRTQDRTMISFSAPWNASTVETCTALISKASECTLLSKFWICRQRNMDIHEFCCSANCLSWAKIAAGLSLHKMQTKKKTPKHDGSGTSASYNTQWARVW